MTPDRNHFLALLLCLSLAGCANSLEPQSTYTPPPGAAPMENKSVNTGELKAEPGHKDDITGAEVVNTESLGDLQTIEVIVPIEPSEVDDVRILGSDGDPVTMTREAEIVHNYETNYVGIKFQVPKSDNLGFRLQLIDHPDDDWPPVRHQ
jgi:hypothetical protein